VGSVFIARGQVYCVVAVDSYMFHDMSIRSSKFWFVLIFVDVIPRSVFIFLAHATRNSDDHWYLLSTALVIQTKLFHKVVFDGRMRRSLFVQRTQIILMSGRCYDGKIAFRHA
jgi:hypothetical protein